MRKPTLCPHTCAYLSSVQPYQKMSWFRRIAFDSTGRSCGIINGKYSTYVRTHSSSSQSECHQECVECPKHSLDAADTIADVIKCHGYACTAYDKAGSLALGWLLWPLWFGLMWRGRSEEGLVPLEWDSRAQSYQVAWNHKYAIW